MSVILSAQDFQKKTQIRNCYKNKLELRPMNEGYALTHAQREAYNGGRSLRAIWSNSLLKANHKLVLLCIAAHLNFNEDFTVWHKISAAQIAAETQLGVRTVHAILKELTELGYLNKQRNFSTETYLQEKNSYRLSDKLFNEHVEYLQKSLTIAHDEHVKEYKLHRFLRKNKKSDQIPELRSANLADQVCKPCIPGLHELHTAPAGSADILPLSFSPDSFPSNSPMCDQKNIHTQGNINAHNSNNSELKQASIIICELLKQKQKRRFIPNFECESLIAKAKLQLKLNNYDEFLSFAKKAINNDHYNKLNSPIGIENTFIIEMKNFIDNENYLSSFKPKEIIIEKTEPLEQAANQFKAPMQKIIGHSFSKRVSKLQTLTPEEISKPNPIEGLSALAKEWYKSLNSTSKQIVIKEIKKYGSEKFSRIILPSIKSFQNFERNVGVAA